MTTIYIKFRHKDDIYAINPDYDLRPDDFIPLRICGRCGDALYIPVELPEETAINLPLDNIYRPMPNHFGIRGEPELPTLGVYKNISYPEQQRLKRFPNMCFVDDNGFEMIIVDISGEPVKHTCADLTKTPQLDYSPCCDFGDTW